MKSLILSLVITIILFSTISSLSAQENTTSENEENTTIAIDKSENDRLIDYRLHTYKVSDLNFNLSNKIGGFNSNDYDLSLKKATKLTNDKSLYFLHGIIRDVYEISKN